MALNSLGGLDINESSLEKVGDANTLDGVDSGGFVRPDGSGFAPIPGATGTPAPEYNVDPLGYVHLQGEIDASGGQLPPGARPGSTRRFAVATSPTAEVLTIVPDGTIDPPNGGSSLDGVIFSAEQ